MKPNITISIREPTTFYKYADKKKKLKRCQQTLQVNSTQYKKLAQNALWFKILNLPNHVKNKTKSVAILDLLKKKLKTKRVMFLISFFSCDLQDSKSCEPQTI